MTFDEYARAHGVEPHIDHGILSPNGRVSNAQRKRTEKRERERYARLDELAKEYYADPERDRRKTIQNRIAQCNARLIPCRSMMEGYPRSRKWKRVVEALEVEIAELRAQLSPPAAK